MKVLAEVLTEVKILRLLAVTSITSSLAFIIIAITHYRTAPTITLVAGMGAVFTVVATSRADPGVVLNRAQHN